MRNILAILIFTIFIFGCSDDEPINPNEPESPTFLELNLISPLNATTDYCNINFIWSATLDSIGFVFDIATDIGFQNVIYTDTLSDTTLTFMQNLQPSTMYYWQVQADSITKMDSFMVQNVADLADFVGTFTAIAYYYHPAEPDTTWQDTIQINFDINGIPTLTELTYNSTITPWNFVSNSSCDVLKYERNNFPTDLAHVYVDLDLTNRTFKFRKYVDSWHFDIYTEYTGSID